MKINTNIKAQVLALAAALSICSSAVCQTITNYAVNVDLLSGDILGIGFNVVLDDWTPPNTTVYQGAFFQQSNTPTRTEMETPTSCSIQMMCLVTTGYTYTA